MLALSRVRNSKGRMEDRKCEKLVDIRESVVSTLTLISPDRFFMPVLDSCSVGLSKEDA